MHVNFIYVPGLGEALQAAGASEQLPPAGSAILGLAAGDLIRFECSNDCTFIVVSRMFIIETDGEIALQYLLNIAPGTQWPERIRQAYLSLVKSEGGI